MSLSLFQAWVLPLFLFPYCELLLQTITFIHMQEIYVFFFMGRVSTLLLLTTGHNYNADTN